MIQGKSIKARVWDSSAPPFPQRVNSLRILLRSSLLSVEKPCPLSRPRTSSPTPFALILERAATGVERPRKMQYNILPRAHPMMTLKKRLLLWLLLPVLLAGCQKERRSDFRLYRFIDELRLEK